MGARGGRTRRIRADGNGRPRGAAAAAVRGRVRPPCVGVRGWLLVSAVVVCIASRVAITATATALPKLPQQYLAGVDSCNRQRLQL